MGIKMATPIEAISNFFRQSVQILRKDMLTALTILGEECVARIRDRSQKESWIDHTGNLRSSIGYAVYEFGLKQMESAFATVGEGSEGSEEGRKVVKELAKEYAKVYALVVVAGMNYASYVEAIEGKDVLASTELWAREQVNSRLERAKESAIKKINALRL